MQEIKYQTQIWDIERKLKFKIFSGVRIDKDGQEEKIREITGQVQKVE